MCLSLLYAADFSEAVDATDFGYRVLFFAGCRDDDDVYGDGFGFAILYGLYAV